MHDPDPEARIIDCLLDHALATGHNLSVNDGEETTLRYSTDRAAIRAAMQTTELDTLTVRKGTRYIGFVLLIYGNGCDLISDYSDRQPALDALLAPALALAESLNA